MAKKAQSITLRIKAPQMSAESALNDKIRRLESELNALRILKRAIPWDDICDEDEAKLLSYFCQSGT